MTIDSGKLRNILSHMPAKPGVYLMRDSIGKIIYVGKSRLLKNRVRSYFSGRQKDPKTGSLVYSVSDIEFIVTSNEIEALVLENNLIKRHKPRYNVMLKDSKTHPYLAVTLSEEFPRFIKVRKVKFNDGNRYFGPFPDEKGLKFIINLLSKTYQLCICKKKIRPAKASPTGRFAATPPSMDGRSYRRGESCFRRDLNLCSGPCAGRISPKEYRVFVDAALSFLTGTKSPDLSFLEARMSGFAEDFRFEEAAELRDTLHALENFFVSQKVEFIQPIDRDFWGLAESPDLLVASIFFVRGGKLLGNRTLEVEREPGVTLEEMLGKLMFQYYECNLIPRVILCSIKPRPLEDLKEHLSKRSGLNTRICFPGKPELKKLLKMADENAGEILTNLKSMDTERVSEGVMDLEKRLSLPLLPKRIECVDISHIQGADPVASLVTALNGIPRKSDYRRYHIKSVEGIDDPASIAEVTRRRFSRLREEGGNYPDFFLVDGGVPQVNAASKELFELGINIPVWGLAKRAETLISSDGRNMKLPMTCPGMRILIRLRNEAHRFANTFQGKTHSRKMVRSALLNLPGVGLKTVQKLVTTFGSLEKAASISPEEMARRASIPFPTARLIYKAVNGKPFEEVNQK